MDQMNTQLLNLFIILSCFGFIAFLIYSIWDHFHIRKSFRNIESEMRHTINNISDFPIDIHDLPHQPAKESKGGIVATYGSHKTEPPQEVIVFLKGIAQKESIDINAIAKNLEKKLKEKMLMNEWATLE